MATQLRHGRYSKFLPSRLAQRFEEALQDPDLISVRQDLALIDTRLSELLGALEQSPEVWSEVTELIERRRRCAETESKRLAQLEQVMTVQQANALIASVLSIVQSHVTDPATRTRIGQDLIALSARNAGPEPRVN